MATGLKKGLRNSGRGSVDVRMTPTPVSIDAINVTTEAPQINMDTSDFAGALKDLAQSLQASNQALVEAIMANNTRIDQLMDAITALAGSQGTVKAGDTTVELKTPERARTFDIDMAYDENNLVQGMRVHVKD